MTDTAVNLKIIEQDPWMEGYKDALMERHDNFSRKLSRIEDAAGSISDYANGYLYFGFQRDEEQKGWWFREWLPGAIDVYLFGDFNNWHRTQFRLRKEAGGVWSIFFPDEEFRRIIRHGTLVKMLVHGKNGWHERIPSYIRRTVQDEQTKNFTGQIWHPEHLFDWTGDNFDIRTLEEPLIYECHIGMAQEEEKVGSYDEFAANVLPRVKELGYNVIQIMGIAEHPYYGSFGYHVSNFFAASSRFGTPEQLKNLIKTAHSMGIAVVMDLVHSHYVKNMDEGLNQLDGTDNLYSPPGKDGYHPYWDSCVFDYSKEQVVHFLLSNVKYWLDEFHFDGFRFDGVTSMIYKHHGYTEFDDPKKYFDESVNTDAIAYLTLANKLAHDIRPGCLTIAEDVSGMPAMCSPIEDGGVGFDYRLAMAVPDFWIKLLKDTPDEKWDIWQIWKIMTDRLPYVKSIGYAESHDQALVGDKTLAFRLMDKEMYTDMNRAYQNYIVERGMALHKMIRLATISLAGQGYLNFMGNEFGHPEWIDFPREGNAWSYKHARRQWSLASDPFLRYEFLNRFDRDMIALVKQKHILKDTYAYNLQMDVDAKTMVYSHSDTLFVLNWHPDRSTSDYIVKVASPGKYKVVLSTDDAIYGGQGRQNKEVEHFTYPVTNNKEGVTEHFMKIYNICRTGVVLEKIDEL